MKMLIVLFKTPNLSLSQLNLICIEVDKFIVWKKYFISDHLYAIS
ncbi:hypothetical protein C874_11895 [Elizabethkingia anophelis 502]|nr:hypothetical protein C874_11895 [Elizabethkingia anophelis 502]